MIFSKIDNFFKKLTLKRKINKCQNISDKIEIELPFHLNFFDKVSINDHCYFGPNLTIDSRGGLIIKKGVIVGPNVTIYTSNHNYNSEILIPYDTEWKHKPVIINEGVWIGGNVVILPGANIGKGCVISAGSVIRGKLPEYEIYSGNPAKKVGKRNSELFDKLMTSNKFYQKQKHSR